MYITQVQNVNFIGPLKVAEFNTAITEAYQAGHVAIGFRYTKAGVEAVTAQGQARAQYPSIQAVQGDGKVIQLTLNGLLESGAQFDVLETFSNADGYGLLLGFRQLPTSTAADA